MPSIVWISHLGPQSNSSRIDCRAAPAFLAHGLSMCIPMSDATFSLVTPMFTAGGFLGSSTANIAMERHGRKAAMQISGLFVAIDSGYVKSGTTCSRATFRPVTRPNYALLRHDGAVHFMMKSSRVTTVRTEVPRNRDLSTQLQNCQQQSCHIMVSPWPPTRIVSPISPVFRVSFLSQ
jgi:hypothetical protein